MANSPDSVAGGIRPTARGFEIDPSVVVTQDGLASYVTSNLSSSRSEATQALNTLYALTGIDPARGENFVHTFDTLAGWTIESLNTSTGATGANTPLPGTDWDGKTYIRAGGTFDSICRGYTTNIAGTYANRNPRVAMLDQVTPWGVACQFQVPTDDGTYLLFGMSDPTVTGITAPKGVYAGFEHGTSDRFLEGYKTNVGAGSGVDTAPSTVLVDGEWHIGYVFSDGSGSYKVLFDGETQPTVLPNTNPLSSVLGSVRICFAGSNMRVSWCSAVW